MISKEATKKCIALSKALTLRDIYTIDFPCPAPQIQILNTASQSQGFYKGYNEFLLSSTDKINQEDFETLPADMQNHISSVIALENSLKTPTANNGLPEKGWGLKIITSPSKDLDRASQIHTDIVSAQTFNDRQYISTTGEENSATNIVPHSDLRELLNHNLFNEAIDKPFSQIQVDSRGNFANPIYSFLFQNRISAQFNEKTQHFLKKLQRTFIEVAQENGSKSNNLMSIVTPHKRPDIVQKNRITLTTIATSLPPSP